MVTRVPPSGGPATGVTYETEEKAKVREEKKKKMFSLVKDLPADHKMGTGFCERLRVNMLLRSRWL